MIILSVLLTLKALLFIKATQVEYYGITILLITAGISLLILSLIGMRKYKGRKTLLSIFYTLISLIMLADVVYYSYFTSLPSVKMLSQAGQLSDVSNSVVSLLNLRNLLFVIDLPLSIYYIFKINKDEEKEYDKKIRRGVPIGLLVGLIIIFTSINVNGQMNSIKFQELYSFHFTDIKTSLEKEVVETLEGNTVLTDEDLQELKDRAKLKEGKYTGLGKDKNLIVVQVEALQNFVINLEYKGQEITPNINRLIKDKSTLYYDNYYQLLGRGNTSDAEFVSNNSLHPSMETPTYDQYQDNTFYGLPWVLRDNGYNAWAFHGYKKDFWNREAAYPNQGFQRFISEEDYEFEEIIELGITDHDFFHQSMDYLKELDSIDDNPFYAFMVTLTSHNPFQMPEEYHVLDIEKKYEGTILGDYLQSIHYTDKCIGEFIDNLKEEGLYDNSVIALYGDHFAIQNTTEEIHDIMEDFLGYKYHYNDIMNIPLVVHLPGEELGETISKVGSQLDFFPTILNIMGYENEKGIVFGRDLNNYEGYTNVTPQTIMRKGSFVDEDIMFEIARTEIFDHSRAIDIKTREELDIHQYRPTYEKAIEEINRSNFILKNDIIKYLLENDGKLDFGAIEVSKINNKDFIKKLDTNTIEGLTESYNKGNQIMTLEIEMTEDEQVILKEGQSIEELEAWAEEYEDAYILCRTQEENMDEMYRKIKYPIPRAKSDFIIEIDSFDEHYFITAHGYENLLLNLGDKDYTDEEILDFLRVHDLFGIVLNEESIKSDLAREIQELGVDVYLEDKAGFLLINPLQY